MRAALLAGLLLSGCAVAGEIAVFPHPSRVGAPPADLGAEAVTVPVPAREALAGWYLDAPAGAPAVLLLHGITDSRRTMVDRARMLTEAGYAVLLVDLPAHGESGGDRVAYGYTERHAAGAAVDFLRRRRPQTDVGVIGVSLGGAAAALAGPGLEADALVLESVFATVEDAVRNRVRRVLGPLSPPAEAALVGQIRPRLGVAPDAIRPAAGLAAMAQPTFVIGGARDPYTPEAETRALFAVAPEPKALWIVDGAAHEDLLEAAPEAYRTRVLAFLGEHLHAR